MLCFGKLQMLQRGFLFLDAFSTIIRSTSKSDHVFFSVFCEFARVIIESSPFECSPFLNHHHFCEFCTLSFLWGSGGLEKLRAFDRDPKSPRALLTATTFEVQKKHDF